MNRRSLTLLETLIALALVLGLAAIIAPSLMSTMEEQAFESAADATEEQLKMARAHARATGNPVEVKYQPAVGPAAGGPRVFASLFDFTASLTNPGSGMTDSQTSPAEAARTRNAWGDGPAIADDVALIAESWADQKLAHGVLFSSRPPSGLARPEFDGMDAGLEDEGSYEMLPEIEQDIRLAVFMPDGSALLGDPIWISDDHGRIGKLTINPWTGQPVFERLTAEEAAAYADELAVEAPASDATDDESFSDDENDARGKRASRPSFQDTAEDVGSGSRDFGDDLEEPSDDSEQDGD